MNPISRILLSLVLLFSAATSRGSQPLLSHYTLRDGLPSNMIYGLFQDSKGYIWFTTDQGVSRFDGTEFKNYSSRDGLPDNDILQMAEDSRHRYWLVCYNFKACYIYEGKVYHAGNDALCRQIEKEGVNYNEMMPDKEGNWCLTGQHFAVVKGNQLHIRARNIAHANSGRAFYFTHQGKEYVSYKDGFLPMSKNETIAYGGEYRRFLYTGKYVFGFLWSDKTWVMNQLGFEGEDVVLLKNIHMPGVAHQILEQADGNILCCTENGMYIYDVAAQKIRKDHTLPAGIRPNCTLTDREGNRWFTTLGEGVYLMPEGGSVIINEQSGLKRNNIGVISLWGDSTIITGDESGSLAMIHGNKIKHYSVKAEGFPSRIIFAGLSPKGAIIAGSNKNIFLVDTLTGANHLFINSGSCKSGTLQDQYCLAGYPFGASLYDLATGYSVFLWDKRTVAIRQDQQGTIWLGSLSGLFYYKNGKTYQYGLDPTLNRSRITCLALTTDGKIVAGTNTNGLYIINDFTLAPERITEAEGLSSNNCRKVIADSGGHMWVCSEGGLDHISLTRQGTYSIAPYLLPDLLSGNKINDMAVKNDKLFLATSEGVVILNKEDKPVKIPLLYINAVNGKSLREKDLNHPLEFDYNKGDLQIAYTGISYTGGPNLQYKYYLKGSNSDTVFTNTRMINFSALKPGSYRLLVWARNKTGSWTPAPASLYFIIQPPLWLNPLVVVPIAVLLVLGLFLLYRFRVKKIKHQAEQKEKISRQMATLEMKALKAQINPHFVFNALNSIQTYYSQNDELKANHYMTAFAQFIRKTLVYSQTHWLPLSEETAMLHTYIELEQMRFKQLFTYTISISPDIDPETTTLPAMLIQPYVENAINHGIRHLKNKQGILLIRFDLKANNTLCCTVEDNGIGIESAQRMRPGNHRSFGMDINRQRIETINQLYHTRVSLKITDRQLIQPAQQGTLIEILIPQKKKYIYDERYHD